MKNKKKNVPPPARKPANIRPGDILVATHEVPWLGLPWLFPGARLTYKFYDKNERAYGAIDHTNIECVVRFPNVVPLRIFLDRRRLP